MEIKVIGTDEYGNEAYRQLFDVIMSDVGKAQMIEYAELILEPKIPIFIISLRLKNSPDSMTMKDAASVRTEGKNVFVSISDERYAPDILSHLWKRYGRDAVEQTTRFDMTIHNASSDDIMDMEITSGEAVMKEMIGAIWRSMPEGIKVRHHYMEGNILTMLATEEIMTSEMKNKAIEVHKRMVG